MKCSYVIDSENNLIRKKWIGKMTVDDEIALICKIISDPKFRKGMNAICDLTEAEVDWSTSELDRLRRYVADIRKTTGECKWAIISSGGITSLTARIFVLLHEAFMDTIEVKLFKTEQEALPWINEVSVGDSSR